MKTKLAKHEEPVTRILTTTTTNNSNAHPSSLSFLLPLFSTVLPWWIYASVFPTFPRTLNIVTGILTALSSSLFLSLHPALFSSVYPCHEAKYTPFSYSNPQNLKNVKGTLANTLLIVPLPDPFALPSPSILSFLLSLAMLLHTRISVFPTFHKTW